MNSFDSQITTED
jgi:hypothetical protein